MSCPICSRKSDAKYRPFCSKRCADIDLGRWMSGNYAIPSDDPEDLEKAAEALSEPPAKPH
ncbi:DNA gyrase inhibitor YacG [Actibacterium ureilyticum]|uniref:DNA gyrase inhibitor YacG n=1 Tax=Actibacterium ureilyticum TaxID=1590614 RepID=UPI000BAAB771|nr:DNA gyrase inhibitor YacG [Actibacterium ureilyticum]